MDKHIKERLENIESETKRDCIILFPSSCHTVGKVQLPWEHGDGWNNIVSDASYEIEALNIMFHDKFGINAVADQIKEKYGTLRFYYSIVYKGGFIIRNVLRILRWTTEKISSNFNFKMKMIEVEKERNDHIMSLIDEKQYEDVFNGTKSHAINVDVNKSDENTFYKVFHSKVYRKTKSVPTSHVMMYRLMTVLNKAYSFAQSLIKEDRKIGIMKKRLDNLVSNVVRRAEHKSETTCEICGASDGDYGIKIGNTLGYITTICSKCADEKNVRYAIGKDIYQNGKIIGKVEDHD